MTRKLLTITTIVAFLVVVLFSVTCKKPEPEIYGGIQGIVKDADTEVPLSGVLVSISPGNQTEATGSDGKYNFSDLDAGDYTIQFSKDGYISDDKDATVNIGETVKVDMDLSEFHPEISLSVISKEISNTSGSFNFEISSNVSWTVSSSSTWLQVTPISGSTNGSVTVSYDSNTTQNQRSAVIVVSGEGVSQNLTVTQESFVTSIALSLSNKSIAPTAGSFSFDVTSNIFWSVSSNTSWLQVSPTTGSHNNSVTVSYDANTTQNQRIAVVTVSGSGVSQTLTVTQEAAAAPYITPAFTLHSPGAVAGNIVLTVESNITWNAVSNSTAWLTVSPQTGTNNGTLTISWTENTSTQVRSGLITLSGTGASNQTVTITQSGAGSILTVSPSSKDIASNSGNFTINLSSNITWSASSSQNWLTLSSHTGTGNTTLTATYTANESVNQRTALLTFSGANVGDQTITVTQTGASVTFSVSPDNHNVASESGSVPFSVTTNTAWSLTCDAAWVSFSAQNGTGNTTVTATYTANTSQTTRIANITFSGTGFSNKIVQITQVGNVNFYAPVSGTVWTNGSNYDISWKPKSWGSLNIKLLKSTGEIVLTIASGTSDDGTESWLLNVPNLYSGMIGSYKIRIESVSGGNSMESENFTVNGSGVAPDFTSPTAGNTWTEGSTYTIQWDRNASGLRYYSTPNYVEIQLFNSSHTKVTTIATDTENDGTHSWTADALLSAVATGSFYIRILNRNYNECLINSETFTIQDTGSPITFTNFVENFDNNENGWETANETGIYLNIENGYYHVNLDDLVYETTLNFNNLDALDNYTIEYKITYLPSSVPIKNNHYGMFAFLWNFNNVADPWTGESFMVGKYADTAGAYCGIYDFENGYQGDVVSLSNLYENGSTYNTIKIITQGENTQFLINTLAVKTVPRINLQNKLGFYFELGEYKIDYLKITKN